MRFRVFTGAIISYAYNHILSHVPSRSVRKLYLAYSLGRLGRNSSVQLGCRFINPRRIWLGDRNVVNFGCLFDGRKHWIKTGDDVSIGPEAAILSLGHDPQSKDFDDRGGDVAIGDRVWIGYRAIILPGVKIGDGAVVSAGAVVTRDIDPYTIVAGSPAKKIGDRNMELSYMLNFDPWLV